MLSNSSASVVPFSLKSMFLGMDTPTYPSDPSLLIGLKKTLRITGFNEMKTKTKRNGALILVKLSLSETLSLLKL